MKKIILSALAVLGMLGATSCSDMLEVESDRQLINPDINQKTDSIFYAFGVLQAVQQTMDQYVFTGEMRGDLVKTTEYTDNNLRQLYNYSATTSNKYDSAYVYYRVINNCNYYIANRDTTLLTGSTNVVKNEYVAMKAYRAWAYLQLVRTYGKVPFFTEPLTAISQINNNNYPELGLDEIVARLTADLAQYAGTPVPTNGLTNQSIGDTNFGTTKNLTASRCYIPVDVILGDLYLEAGRYEEAAKSYANFFITTGKSSSSMIALVSRDFERPSDMYTIVQAGAWEDFFSVNPSRDIITYIPMPVNQLQGVTTGIPEAFGFNYYANSLREGTLDEIQIMPSTKFWEQSYTDYYYYTDYTYQSIKSTSTRDSRVFNYIEQGQEEDSTKYWMQKYNYANIVLYRYSTVWLHLAEAVNRMGYPEVAFAILKEGINDNLLKDDYSYYITEDSRKLLTETLPFLSDANKTKFEQSYLSGVPTIGGIHMHGAGVTYDGNYPGSSPYQLDTIAGLMLEDVAEQYGITVGETKLDTINAVEDIICNEYAMEIAFEGTRYPDLLRLATHKNGHAGSTSQYNGSPASYGADFGTKWLIDKLTPSTKDARDARDASVLADKSKWYLPFK